MEAEHIFGKDYCGLAELDLGYGFYCYDPSYYDTYIFGGFDSQGNFDIYGMID